jgi:hypothetical protein
MKIFLFNLPDPAWSCTGSATLKVLAQKEGKEDHVRKISHNFHAKENDWGFAQFMSFDVSAIYNFLEVIIKYSLFFSP